MSYILSIEVMLKEKCCMQGRLGYVSGHYAKYDPYKQNKTQHSLNMNYFLTLLYLFLIKIPLTNVKLPPLYSQWHLFCQWVKSSMVLSIRLYSKMSQSHVYDKSSYMSTLISREDVWYRLCVQLSVITNSFIAQIYSNCLARRKNLVIYVIIRRSCVTLCPLLWWKSLTSHPCKRRCDASSHLPFKVVIHVEMPKAAPKSPFVIFKN